MRHTYFKTVAIAATGLLCLALTTSPANATGSLPGSFTFNIAPSGANVVVTGSGTMNLAGDNNYGTASGYYPQVNATSTGIASGPGNSSYSTIVWNEPSGPSSFGSGSNSTSIGTGDFVEFQAVNSGSVEFGVPPSYVSNALLSDTSTYSNTTLAAMGLTPGSSYTWSWAAGTTTDTVTLNVASAAVPEPTSLSLLGFGAMGPLRRRSRRPAAI